MYKHLKNEIEKLKQGGCPLSEFYQIYGQCRMALELKAITQAEFMILNHDVIAKGINNPQYFNNH